MPIQVEVVGDAGMAAVGDPLRDHVRPKPDVEVVLSGIVAEVSRELARLPLRERAEFRQPDLLLESRQRPGTVTAGRVCEERIEEVARPMHHAVGIALFVVEDRRTGGIRRAAEHKIVGDAASSQERDVASVSAADEGMELVLPVDLRERIGRAGIGIHVGQERVVEEEPALVGVEVLERGKADLLEVRLALHPPRRFPG